MTLREEAQIRPGTNYAQPRAETHQRCGIGTKVNRSSRVHLERLTFRGGLCFAELIVGFEPTTCRLQMSEAKLIPVIPFRRSARDQRSSKAYVKIAFGTLEGLEMLEADNG